MTIERQLNYVLQLVRLLQSGQAREISPRTEPTEAYNAALQGESGRLDLGVRMPKLVHRRQGKCSVLSVVL